MAPHADDRADAEVVLQRRQGCATRQRGNVATFGVSFWPSQGLDPSNLIRSQWSQK